MANTAIRTRSLKETEELGERLGSRMRPGDVLCLSGQLGAGKTAITRGIARGWGSEIPATSPTFTLINRYEREQKDHYLYHVDAYRLNSREDALSTGIEDIFYGEDIVVIEWPERLDKMLIPSNAIHVTIAMVADDERELTFAGEESRISRLLS